MTSKVKRVFVRITATTLIWFILAITSVGSGVISMMNLSNFIYYFADVFNVILAFIAIRELYNLENIKEMQCLKILLVLYVVDCIIGIISNRVPLLLVVWGVRNVFRFIVFFISCTVILNVDSIQQFLNMFPKIYVLNALIAFIQGGILGLKGDYIGGLFGTEKGCNGALTIFINIAISYFVARYLCGNEDLKHFVFYSVLYFIVAAWSETKGNFVFYIVIVMVALIVSKKNIKVLGILIVAGISCAAGIYFLNKIFPDSLSVLLSLDEANHYMDAVYFGNVTFTRNALLKVANEVFFVQDKWLYLFGYGIGACDTSAYFSSPFYKKYGYMNYRQYSAAMTVLQNGYIGLILYFSFFVGLFILSLKKISDEEYSSITYVFIMSCCLSVFAIADSFYASLYIDFAYWLFFALAIPIVFLKNNYYVKNNCFKTLEK